jgi:hypothetical protein
MVCDEQGQHLQAHLRRRRLPRVEVGNLRHGLQQLLPLLPALEVVPVVRYSRRHFERTKNLVLTTLCDSEGYLLDGSEKR